MDVFFFILNRGAPRRVDGSKQHRGRFVERDEKNIRMGNLPGCGQLLRTLRRGAVSRKADQVHKGERDERRKGPGVRFLVAAYVFPSGNVGEIELQEDSISLFLFRIHIHYQKYDVLRHD